MSGMQTQMAGMQTRMVSLQTQVKGVQRKVDDSDKGFLSMFKYMSKRFDSIDKKLAAKADKNTVDLIYNQLDSFLKRTDTDEIERAALAGQVGRHEGWIQQVAKTTGDRLRH